MRSTRARGGRAKEWRRRHARVGSRPARRARRCRDSRRTWSKSATRSSMRARRQAESRRRREVAARTRLDSRHRRAGRREGGRRCGSREAGAGTREVWDGRLWEWAEGAPLEHAPTNKEPEAGARGGAGVQKQQGPIELHEETPAPRHGRLAFRATRRGQREPRKDPVESLEVVSPAAWGRSGTVEVNRARTPCVKRT